MQNYKPKKPKPELWNTLLYRNNLKDQEFDKEASLNSHLESATIVPAQGASEDESLEKKPTPSKTDPSGCFGIYHSRKINAQIQLVFYREPKSRVRRLA
jgi:hypothetical protein